MKIILNLVLQLLHLKGRYWDYFPQEMVSLKMTKNQLMLLHQLTRSTDEIMSLLEDPTRQDSWDRRGMVVGNVQSGKTSNFIALA